MRLKRCHERPTALLDRTLHLTFLFSFALLLLSGNTLQEILALSFGRTLHQRILKPIEIDDFELFELLCLLDCKALWN